MRNSLSSRSSAGNRPDFPLDAASGGAWREAGVRERSRELATEESATAREARCGAGVGGVGVVAGPEEPVSPRDVVASSGFLIELSLLTPTAPPPAVSAPPSAGKLW